jgi:Divergent InlB B-repeat domain
VTRRVVVAQTWDAVRARTTRPNHCLLPSSLLGSRSGRTLFRLAFLVLTFLILVSPALAAPPEYTGVSFGPDGTSGTKFEHAGALAVDQSTHDVYAADYGNGTVYKFNEKGEAGEFSGLASRDITGLSFSASEPNVGQIAVDSSTHDFYVVNYGTKSLKAFQANGEPAVFSALASSEIGGFSELCGVAVDQNGDIYAGDFHTGVHVYAPSGEELASFLPTLSSCNIAVDSHGDVYANHWEASVEKFTPSVYPVTLATTYISAGIVDATPAYGLTVDPAADELYVDEKTGIAQYDEHGTRLGTFAASGPGAVSGSEGVAIDAASGDAYVSDSVGERQVGIFGPSIEQTLTVTREGTTGTVTSSPARINCGATCSAGFAQNSTVTLTATPIGHSKFTGWSGPDAGSCGTLPTCEVQIGTSDRAITATFAFATLEWGLSLEHHNPYGAQGGVDPFTGSGTTFDRESGGNEYKITVTNTGEAATSGVVTVVDQLPEGIVLAGTTTEEVPEVSGEGWTCTVLTGASTATCTRSNGLSSREAYPPIILHVHANPGAANPSTNVVSISGGGAATATASDPTTIATVPFGVQSFTTSVTEALGNPFTQAGGHPFAASATFVLDYVSDDEGGLRTVGGSPKDIETQLPPGFVGNPQAEPKCPVTTFETGGGGAGPQEPCPINTAVGYIHFSYSSGRIEGGHAVPLPSSAETNAIYNLTTSGSPAAFGFIGGLSYARYTLLAKVRSDGDYGVTISSPYTAKPTPLAVELTFCAGGVTESGIPSRPSYSCTPAVATGRPLLTNPTQCSSTPPVTTLSANSYQNPANYASITSYTGAPSAAPASAGAPTSQASPVASSFVTGCNLLQFSPKFEFEPETKQADAPTGMKVNLSVLQTNEASANATPELKDATVTLPEGMSADPSAADGLQACTDAQFGLGSKTEPAEPANCPAASQIATARVVSPLLERPLEGQVFLGQPQCSPCSTQDAQEGHIFRLFLQAQGSGVLVKVAGKVSADPITGRLTAVFKDQPQLPFSLLELSFKGGPRAPLANPQACGAATVGWDMTPWSAPGLGGLSGTEAIPGTPDAIAQEPAFNVDWDGNGGACPSSDPFNPGFQAQTSSSAAAAFTPFTVEFSRGDREQDLGGVSVQTPPGLLGKIAGIPQCPEAQANAGSCSAESQLGTVTAQAGAGSDPFTISGGRVYLTGPYKGQPFGLSVVVPAVAGPFNLGNIVVRASIAVNPSTGQLTVTSDPLPQIQDGVPFRLRRVSVEINRPGFMFNPTNCSAQLVSATLTGVPVKSGEAAKSVGASSSFAASGCAGLPFAPTLTASTQAHASRQNGASLDVEVAQKPGEANIQKVDVQLPKLLPSRLTTLQKACTDAQFKMNPAGCPEASNVGTAVAHTPVLNSPLSGPAYLVSHGGAAFPDLEVVLQGEGITLVLDGATQIKNGVTFSRFETVPDAPISSFELKLPEGPHSILGAPSGTCGQELLMPTTITAQSGKQTIQSTRIAVSGCRASKPLTRAQKLAKALKECRKKHNKRKRRACERQARRKYGPIKKAKKTNRRGK